jgi:nitroimidazol reductase NimA-like FMN-containing flavoprotein (pyridoxamine 5'-phosphate oxidase superfamily)
MSRELLNLTTATRDNALTEEEREAFLAEKRVARMASNRGDGWSHVTPIWYVWEGGRFHLSLGNSRRHLQNLREDPHVTMCVDEDPRITDLSQAPRSVVCFGLAKLIEDEETVREFTEKMELRYLGGIPPEFHEALWFEGRTIVEITPVRWLAWDQGKG